MVGVLDLAGYVQKQGEIGRAQGQESFLNRLAGQAYSAAPEQRTEILSQMATASPQAAQVQQEQFRTGDADRVSQLSQRAKLFVGMAEANNQAAVAGMYPQIAREARELFGVNVPDTYDPNFLSGIKQFAALGDGTSGGNVQSTYIDDRGQRVAIMRDGSTQVLGGNAPNNQIIDTGNGFYGVNKGNLQAAPVQIGGGAPQQPQAPQAGMYQTPQGVVRLGDDLTPEQREAAMADIAAGGQASAVQLPDRNTAPQQFGGGQLRSAPKPASVPAGYRETPNGLEPIPGGPAQIAIDARADAAAARQDAADLKASAAKQAQEARQVEAASAANQLINSIDLLTKHPGFADLGTAMGDAKIGTPFIRNAAKDADAQLKNIAGQVALTTMARLKALSATGATGFGSLTKPELTLLENSIATLQSENISNAQLTSSLKIIRDTLEKTTSWQPPQDSAPSNAIAPPSTPSTGGWGIQKVD